MVGVLLLHDLGSMSPDENTWLLWVMGLTFIGCYIYFRWFTYNMEEDRKDTLYAGLATYLHAIT